MKLSKFFSVARIVAITLAILAVIESAKKLFFEEASPSADHTFYMVGLIGGILGIVVLWFFGPSITKMLDTVS